MLVEAQSQSNNINSWWLINYKEFYQSRIACSEHENEAPYVTLHSALVNTFSDNNYAFIILDGHIMALTKSLDSIYVFDCHARNCFGMPDPNGTAVLMKCSAISILVQYLCDLAFELHTNIFEVVPVEISKEQICENEILISQTKCSNVLKRKRSQKSNSKKKQRESEKQARLDKTSTFNRAQRLNATESERWTRLNKRNAFDRQKSLNETESERRARLNKRNAFNCEKRLNETDSERNARVSKRKSRCKKRKVEEK